MAALPDPFPADEPVAADLDRLAAAYLDLWEENWSAWLAPTEDEEGDPA